MNTFKFLFIALLGLFIVNSFFIGIQASQVIHYYFVFPLIVMLIFLQRPSSLSIANVANGQKPLFLILTYILLELLFNAIGKGGLQNFIKTSLAILYQLLLPFAVYFIGYNFMSYEKGNIIRLLYTVRRLVLMCLIVIIPGFVLSVRSATELNEFATNVSVFVFVFFIPFIMLKKSKWNLLIIILIVIAILFTAKRGAVLGGILAYLITLLFDSKINVFKKLLFIFLPLVFFSVLNIFFTEQIDKVYERFEKESEVSDSSEYGSMRGEIWAVHFVKFAQGTTAEKLFGFGSGSSGDLTERFSIRRVSAHNAYIGIGFEYGLVGLFFLILFLLNHLIIIKKAYKENFIYANLMLYTIVLIIINGFTEVQFETYYIIYPYFFLGCMSGLLKNKKFRIDAFHKRSNLNFEVVGKLSKQL